jgi:mannose-P-dolichol utilization defect protein 1
LFYTEIVMLINSSGYSIKENIPFSVYGESLLILVQNFLIVLLFWIYSKDITAIEKLVLFVFFSGYSFVLFKGYTFLTKSQWDMIQKSNLVLSLLSRVPQIMTNFANKSTG